MLQEGRMSNEDSKPQIDNAARKKMNVVVGYTTRVSEDLERNNHRF